LVHELPPRTARNGADHVLQMAEYRLRSLRVPSAGHEWLATVVSGDPLLEAGSVDACAGEHGRHRSDGGQQVRLIDFHEKAA
jgi:hypothetical protein